MFGMPRMMGPGMMGPGMMGPGMMMGQPMGGDFPPFQVPYLAVLPSGNSLGAHAPTSEAVKT